ncbi:hypothetical protein A0H76_360 [Hepatospora eriocheir]|uniref:Uncharacterized protein n=1 Tax=Hepatospora eriocheir TaxID=1081669 RepID=A0A1X0QBW2_9MICR|nr:hypothetical protein A0H76_360 [Hepatospora eriocheir]
MYSSYIFGDYVSAVRYSKRRSFQRAYGYYKLKKYSKALKTLNKIKKRSLKCKILKSQCLYYKGCYKESFEILYSLKDKDLNEEGFVNFAILKALAGVDTDRVSVIKDANFKLQELYNSLFKYVDNDDLFIAELEELDKEFDVSESVVKKQIANLKNENLSDFNFSSKEHSIINYNNHNGSVDCRNLLNFQKEVFIQNTFFNSKTRNFKENNRLMLLNKAFDAVKKFSEEKSFKILEKILDKHSNILLNSDIELLKGILYKNFEKSLEIINLH